MDLWRVSPSPELLKRLGPDPLELEQVWTLLRDLFSAAWVGSRSKANQALAEAKAPDWVPEQLRQTINKDWDRIDLLNQVVASNPDLDLANLDQAPAIQVFRAVLRTVALNGTPNWKVDGMQPIGLSN